MNEIPDTASFSPSVATASDIYFIEKAGELLEFTNSVDEVEECIPAIANLLWEYSLEWEVMALTQLMKTIGESARVDFKIPGPHSLNQMVVAQLSLRRDVVLNAVEELKKGGVTQFNEGNDGDNKSRALAPIPQAYRIMEEWYQTRANALTSSMVFFMRTFATHEQANRAYLAYAQKMIRGSMAAFEMRLISSLIVFFGAQVQYFNSDERRRVEWARQATARWARNLLLQYFIAWKMIYAPEYAGTYGEGFMLVSGGYYGPTRLFAQGDGPDLLGEDE